MAEHSTHSNLFYDRWDFFKKSPYFLNIVIGGRGIGKTYSILKGVLTDKLKFMYIRRSETELKNACKPLNNPFNFINEEMNREVLISPNQDSFIVHEGKDILGVAGAIGTFGKFRGSDFSFIDYIVFDEFIATSPYDRLIKYEADLFFNMIETVQRNREILGKTSTRVIMLANSNSLNNGVIKELKLAEIIRLMKISNQEEYADEERGIYINLPCDLKISKAKESTSLYKLTKGTTFHEMAISNDFVSEDFNIVRKIPNNQLTPLVGFGTAFFYNIKNKDTVYCSYRKHDGICFDEKSMKIFKRRYGMFFSWLIDNNKLTYSDYNLTLFVKSMFK